MAGTQTASLEEQNISQATCTLAESELPELTGRTADPCAEPPLLKPAATLRFRWCFTVDSEYNATMKLSGQMLGRLAGALALCVAPGVTWAITSANPYEAIIERNVFSLKPPPPPVDTKDANKQPPAKVILTGITTILGYPQALLKTAAAPAARAPVKAGVPPQAPKGDQFYILRQGEREGDIEVLDINPKAETVKIKQDGTEFVLDFEKNGQKPAGAVAGGPPGVIPPPTGFGAGAVPQPTGMPKFNMPIRPMRTASSGAPSAGGFGQAAQTGGFGMPSTTASLSPQQQAAQLSPEANALLIEAERERLQQAGNPLANLMPITRATPTGAPGMLTPPGAATPQVPGVQQPYYPTFPGRVLPPAPQ